MTREEIARRRMRNQRLWGRPPRTPVDVVGHLGAMQGQDYGVAKWSVAQRAGRATAADVERAFNEGAILRTHLLRTTWHLVLPSDLRWLMDLTGPRVSATSVSHYRKWGLDEDVLKKSGRLFAKALKSGAQLTRKEMAGILGRAGITPSGPQMGWILMRAELDGIIVSGARRGKQQTYALFEERVPDAATMDRDAALSELTRRYFTTRGPATVKDFAWWSSLTTADIRRGIEMLGSELSSRVVDGRTYWFAKSSSRAKPVSTVVDLVQGLDECIVSYTESKDVLFPSSSPVRVAPNEIVFNHVVLLDGQLLGQWRPVERKKEITVEVLLYRELTTDETDALQDAVARFGRSMELPTTVALLGQAPTSKRAGSWVSTGGAGPAR
jgi:Winged helix DNA-binding domain